jgi:hypothetical protein
MANAVRIVWRGLQVAAQVDREIEKRLGKCGEMLASQIRRNLSGPYPPASLPGEFPHLRTGKLRQSVHWERMGSKRVRVGSPLHYAAIHEFTERPFVRRTFVEMHGKLRRELLREIPGIRGHFGLF